MRRLELKPRYTRSDPNGSMPRITGRPALPYNHLGISWRPLIDLTDSEFAPLRLRMTQPVSTWLADRSSPRWSWFSRIGVAGLRHQVLRHAGLDRYDCVDPRRLPGHLRTPQWRTLVAAVDGFAELDWRCRSLVIVQLIQLSYYHVALRLAGDVAPNGDPSRDRYLYEVARAYAGTPGRASRALGLFESLAASSSDPRLALAACFQGIGHAIRSGRNLTRANRFEACGRELVGLADDRHTALVSSRFHRASALLRLAEGDRDGFRRELQTAVRHHEQLLPGDDDTDRMLIAENRRYLLELQLDSASRAADEASPTEVRDWCAELIRIDPNCGQARLLVGDAFTGIGDYPEAARWYCRAGELGTGAGALGWYRAGQCFEFLGDRGSAVHAMSWCLELDRTAVEPREYLAGLCQKPRVT